MDYKLLIALIFYFSILGIPLIFIAYMFFSHLYRIYKVKKIEKNRAKLKVLLGGKRHTEFTFRKKS